MAENARKWGGKRLNSGRPKGAQNRIIRKEIAEAAEKGLTPLQYALDVLGDEKQPQARRDAMCALAMPFVHPRLAAVMTSHTNTEPIREITWRILQPADAPLATVIEHRESEVEE